MNEAEYAEYLELEAALTAYANDHGYNCKVSVWRVVTDPGGPTYGVGPGLMEEA